MRLSYPKLKGTMKSLQFLNQAESGLFPAVSIRRLKLWLIVLIRRKLS